MNEKKRPHLSASADKTVSIIWFGILAMVAAASLIPHAGPPDAGIGLDKALHGIPYTLLAYMAMGLFQKRRTALLLAAAMVPTGFLLEIVQSYIPGRTFSAGDMLANNLGVLAGLGMGILWRVKRRNARQHQKDLSL